MHGFSSVAGAVGGLALASSLHAQPVYLTSYGSTLFRVRAGVVESFPGQPGSLIGMTVVPPGAGVTGAGPGDVLVIEGSGGSKIWRLDNPVEGIPELVLLGNFPEGQTRGDITFASGRLFGIESALIHEYSVTDFSLVGTIDLERPQASTGGIAFDGDSTWYIANQTSGRIIALPDPPTPEGWQPLGDSGIAIGNNDLDWFRGELWLATDVGGTLVLGTIDLATGAFRHALDVAPTTTARGVALAILNPCRPDLNGDGAVNTQDFIRFLGLWSAGDPGADWNRDGAVDSRDFLAFLNDWSAGCD